MLQSSEWPSLDKILDSDQRVLVDEILSTEGYETATSRIRELDEALFVSNCRKGYLAACEPEYCAYRYTEACAYVRAVSLLLAEYGIGLISRTREPRSNAVHSD